MKKAHLKKTSLTLAIILVCVIAFAYWIHNQFHIETDDAYVNANVVQIAPRVTGEVEHLYIVNNQYVKAGQLLFDLDPATFNAAVDQSQAQLNVNESNMKLAEVTAIRTGNLVKRKFASAQEGDNTQAQLQAAIANVQLAKANLVQAELNLQYTKIFAPTSGWVTNVTLRIGDLVTANQPLFALINDSEFWVDANFKETDIMYLHAGQHATVVVDMYPNHPFEGVLESISGGTGAAFSLLPAENATGNWVKVTQRVPVRIHIKNSSPHFPLRIGTSATVTIHVNPWSPNENG